MPKFYFQLTDGLTKVVDGGGQVFADVSEARHHVSASTEAFSRRIAQFNSCAGLYWSVQVMDETGSQVFTLALGRPGRSERRSEA